MALSQLGITYSLVWISWDRLCSLTYAVYHLRVIEPKHLICIFAEGNACDAALPSSLPSLLASFLLSVPFLPTVLFKQRWSSLPSACCSAATCRLDGPWAWSELSDHSGCMLIRRTDSARHVPSLLTQQLKLTCVAVRCRVFPVVVASCSS